ncbi:beta-mannosidase [Fulvivirgaceae bacterium PWU5]|uniref:Mannan endo-1,4-beta-mannosidase n=1 Tax=Dawidia cretensis TaxID=2782350 RepID=A0AAP2DZE4_9BACT|nr:glycosyl hydrolase [Dawidia cretensis]MBT1709053.1 beta-mannosidase [Dawidia cretensis]
MIRSLLYILVASIVTIPTFAQHPLDPQATAGTASLYRNLQSLSTKGILFGHHETDAYGVGWTGTEGRSDIKDVCGAYPAVHGWDLGKEGQRNNIDGVPFESMHRWIRDVYTRGGINTISWHVDNPVTGGGSWDTTRAVQSILPGGKQHADFVQRLDRVAAFLAACRHGHSPIPIIFRPFHEHNGNWFWWGKGLCTEEEYIQLWRFTIDYLKNTKGLHHILYAFSPDRSRMNLKDARSSYLYGYPGDDYVDILGYDNYMDVGITWNKKSPEEQADDLRTGLSAVSALAREKKKVAAFTETGLEGVTNPSWYTDIILKPLKSDRSIQMAYIMVWRNGNDKHHYAPYPGHPAAADFQVFYQDPYTVFENDLEAVYR